MSSPSRGFFASMFGTAKREGPPPLFPPRPPRDRAPPGAARPPAPPPGIVIDPPRAERPAPPLPPEVPPPTPPELVAAPPPRALPVPPPARAPAPTPDAAAEPLLLVAPTLPAAARAAALVSALPEGLPPPLPLARTAARVGEDVPHGYVERPDLRAGAVHIDRPGFWGRQLRRLVLAPAARARDPLPLLHGTERFTNEFFVNWHRTPRPLAPEIACSFVGGAIVTGPGHVWLDGALVTAPEQMQPYAREAHRLPEQGAALLAVHKLPLREIAEPCVVLISHGLHVYGHFVTELLLRALLTQRMLREHGLTARWLLDAAAPAWLLRILQDDLGIPPADIEFFRAAEERVRLRCAILPGHVHHDQGYPPLAEELVEALLARLAPLPETPPAARVFLVRRGYRNAESVPRECRNEPALVALAEARGFRAVAPEDLSWREQLALLRNAEIIAGTYGSALHTALVSPAGTRIGVIGALNIAQSEIAALRGHHIAYLTNGFAPEGQFSVPEDAFAAFLDALCAPLPGARAPEPAPAPVLPPAAAPGRVSRIVLAASAAPLPPGPLIAGTDSFAVGSQRDLHREPRPAPAHDAAVYLAEDVVVTGSGQLWVDGARLLAPDLPARDLAEADTAAAPARTLDAPCLAITGARTDSEAAFLLTALPRLLLARRALADSGERLHVLLDSAAPDWAARLLREDAGVAPAELHRFAAPAERVRLRRAVLPAPLQREGGFLPVVNDLLAEWLAGVALPEVAAAPRLFLQRPPQPGAAADAPRGDCGNEPALLALTESRHGFVPLAPEALPWRAWLARLLQARIVLLAHGVAPDLLLFGAAGTRVAAIGARGRLLAEIAALRGEQVAYLSEGVPPRGPFTLQEARFAEFLDVLCDPGAAA